MRIVLDTHILIQISQNQLPSASRRKLLESASNELFYSNISLWEITKLVELKRIEIKRSLVEILSKFETHPKLKQIHFDAAILNRVNLISKSFHKDPADQLITATALELKASLMTDDQLIIASKLVSIV